MKSNCSTLLDLRNLQEQLKKHSVTQKLFWPFTVWINCSSDIKNFTNIFFLAVGQNKISTRDHYLKYLFGQWKFELIFVTDYFFQLLMKYWNKLEQLKLQFEQIIEVYIETYRNTLENNLNNFYVVTSALFLMFFLVYFPTEKCN